MSALIDEKLYKNETFKTQQKTVGNLNRDPFIKFAQKI
jgi:hypothetical protein